MLVNEISLIAFTLLAQISFGIIWNLSGIKLSYKLFGKNDLQKINKSSFTLSFILLIIALGISFLHLGTSKNAVYALNNLESSWLSREILTASIFAFLLFLMNVFIRINIPEIVKNTALILSFISGFLFIFSMSEIYRLPTVPSWNSIEVLVDFFSCGIILGGLIFALISVYHSNELKSEKQFRSFYNSVFGYIITFILIDLFFVFFAKNPEIKQLNNPDNILYLMKIIQSILIIIVLIIIVFKISRIRQKSRPPRKNLLVAVFIIMLIAEIIGRIVFYQSYTNIGL